MQNAAFRLGLIMTLFAFAHLPQHALGQGARKWVHEKHHQNASDEDQAPAKTLPQYHPANPEEHKKPCDNPANSNEDDTCSQARSAKAAEDSVTISKEQLNLGWAGLYAGIVSAVATAIAAIAAAVAARAAKDAVIKANEANELNRRLFVEENRPRISIESVNFAKTSGIEFTDDNKIRINISVIIKNSGIVSAYNAQLHAFEFFPGETMERVAKIIGEFDPPKIGLVVPKDKSEAIVTTAFAGANANVGAYLFAVVVYYRCSISHTLHCTCHAVHIGGAALQRAWPAGASFNPAGLKIWPLRGLLEFAT